MINKISKRSIAGVVILFGLVGLTSWYAVKSTESHHPKLKHPNLIPSSQIHNAQFIQMNSKGQKHLEIYLTSGTEYPNQILGFNSAHAIYYSKSQKPTWYASSLKGKYFQKTQILNLTQNAKLYRKALNHIPAVQFTAPFLSLNNQTKTAQTHTDIDFKEIGTGLNTRATGLFAQLNLKQINLLNNVKSLYPAKNKNIKNLNTIITSQTAQINLIQKIGFYQNHIKITRGLQTFTGNKLTAYQNKSGSGLKQLILSGTQNHPAHYYYKPKSNLPVTAMAQTMQYHPKQNLIYLKGHAEVNRGGNKLTGDILYYNTQTQTITSPSTQTAHSTMTIEPINQLKNKKIKK